MIKVNGREHTWYEDMTIESLIQDLKYTYPILIVTVNGEHVEKSEYPLIEINEGDDVKIIHPIAGG